MHKVKKQSLFCLFTFVLIFKTSLAQSQIVTATETPTATPTVAIDDSSSDQVQTAEGTSGSVDRKHRAPVISVNPVVEDTQVRILADAYVPNDTYKEFPIQFDFYVNRKLILTQIRSIELPGPVGLNVGTDIATPPFNYTVIATVLHTNRQFVSIANGAVYANNLSGTFSCTLTESSSSSDSSSENTFTIDSTSVTQSGPASVTVKFKGISADLDDTSSDATREVNASLDISSESSKASGTLTIDSQSAQTVSGTVSFDSTTSKLSSLNVKSEAISLDSSAKTYSLDCEKILSDSSGTEALSSTDVTSALTTTDPSTSDSSSGSLNLSTSDPASVPFNEFSGKVKDNNSGLEKAVGKLFGQ